MLTNKKLNIVCYGEVLWDVFPEEEKIGGAPLNVALRFLSLDHNVAMISRVGNDKRGKDIITYTKEHGMNTDFITIDNYYETGNVQVMINEKGSASYDIMFPRAWDKIETSPAAVEVVNDSDIFVYGSLAARNPESRESLFKLIYHANYKVFDVNLRAPYYTKELLIGLMESADFIKFNDDELFEISESLGAKSASLEQNMLFIAEKTNTRHICVTKGRHGAVLLYNGEFYHNSGYHVVVVDTVGAGDSFLAALLCELLSNNNPQKAIDYACAVGAMVASHKGANPKLEFSDIETFLNPQTANNSK